MKKLLIAAGTIVSLLSFAPLASAQDYTYDCLCRYSSPSGACLEYTCDAYQRSRRSSYYDDCRYDSYGCNSSYNRSYRSYNSYNSYDGRSDYDWYYSRYSNTSPYRRYSNQYYDYPMYYY
ncbi:MAG: hypothetical protein PHS73_03855 [Candidatus Peribacteraceae bacterium]|nr:hypothetical protein [Candidatus Peribacteraceae bacterium]